MWSDFRRLHSTKVHILRSSPWGTSDSFSGTDVDSRRRERWRSSSECEYNECKTWSRRLWVHISQFHIWLPDILPLCWFLSLFKADQFQKSVFWSWEEMFQPPQKWHLVFSVFPFYDYFRRMFNTLKIVDCSCWDSLWSAVSLIRAGCRSRWRSVLFVTYILDISAVQFRDWLFYYQKLQMFTLYMQVVNSKYCFCQCCLLIYDSCHCK